MQADAAGRAAYIEALKQLFESTKGMIIKVPASLDGFRKAQPDYAPRVLQLMVDKGLVYPTTFQRTQIRGDIDAIFNALSRAERWGTGEDIPDDFNPLWRDLCALYTDMYSKK